MTELIWDGKYKDDKKQGPVRIALPFQAIETVNESAQDRRRNLELFASGRDTDWRNRLIGGDKKYVLPSLLPEFAGKVNLIYIDPPFDTGADFSFTATIPAHTDASEHDGLMFVKEPSILEQKAYRDTWGKGLDSYLEWLHESFVFLHELLAPAGSLYVHIGANVSHYVEEDKRLMQPFKIRIQPFSPCISICLLFKNRRLFDEHQAIVFRCVDLESAIHDLRRRICSRILQVRRGEDRATISIGRFNCGWLAKR